MSWFSDWFDSPYYPILYQHRNDAEAQEFMHHLLVYLKLTSQSRLMDMACGRGRHSIELARRGYEVLGMDLSPESIADANAIAQQNPHLRLSFGVWDMRQPFAETFGKFDAVLNLFTSFGYFETETEHQQTLANMAQALRSPDSRLVIDFFNAQRTMRQLVLSETKTLQGIDFHINRYVENGYIVKDIRFVDQGQHHHYQERVRAFLLPELQLLLQAANLAVIDVFGNYRLQPFDANTSDRMVVVAARK